MSASHDDHPHVPGPSLWPVGFAVGVVVALVGLIISWYVAGLGVIVALAFAFLWIRDLTAGSSLAHAPEVAPESAAAAAAAAAAEPEPAHVEPGVLGDRYPRSKFLELSTLGLGGVLGGLLSAPAIGFMVLPPFLKQGVKDHDIGPLTDYPEGKYVVATFMLDAKEGVVSRRSAYVRNNGQLNGQPSFTIISNHCAHLGCPVQPNGPLDPKGTKTFGDVTLIPDDLDRRLRLPVSRRPVRHRGQPDRRPAGARPRPLLVLDQERAALRRQALLGLARERHRRSGEDPQVGVLLPR